MAATLLDGFQRCHCLHSVQGYLVHTDVVLAGDFHGTAGPPTRLQPAELLVIDGEELLDTADKFIVCEDLELWINDWF